MLLLDRITEFKDGESIVGYKNVTANEYFFQGHFPGRPILPGVFILEALAQLGVVFAKICSDAVDQDTIYLFAGADEVKWRKPVIPGDSLRLQMTLLRRRKGYWKMKGEASVDGEKVAEAILHAAQSPWKSNGEKLPARSSQ